MKKELLFVVLLSTPMAMGAYVELGGARECASNKEYHYTAELKRDNEDKKKGELGKDLYYEWHVLGTVFVPPGQFSAKADRITVYSNNIKNFSPNPLSWPRGTVSCTIRFCWTKKPNEGHERSSNPITVVLSPMTQPTTPPVN